MKILNMKTLIVLFFFITFFNNYAQDEKTENDSTYIIELKEFYDGKGVIFSKDVRALARHCETDQRISLNIEDVIEAEQIIDSSVTVLFKDDKNKKNAVISKLRGYYRQYWGFKSTSDEKRIMVFMFNFNDPDMRKQQEEYWDKGATFDTGWSGGNVYILDINLTKRQIDDNGFPPFKYIKIP